jgi:cell division protein FtsI/penicillin-binding protein 2
MFRVDTMLIRLRLFFLLVFIGMGVLAYRMHELQIVRHDELYEKARLKYTENRTETGLRGKIFDYSGNLLVGNLPCKDIFADPQTLKTEEEARGIAEYFAKTLGVPEAKLFDRLVQRTRVVVREDGTQRTVPILYAPIAQYIDLEQAKRIEDDMRALGINGPGAGIRNKKVFFRESFKRFYPKNELLANILGFTNLDREKAIPVVGIEKSYHQNMSPSQAKIRYERARDGFPLTYGTREEEEEARNGYNLYLTVQEPIQAILEEELDKLMEKWTPKAAYAVMAEPFTGNILAIAQRPTFNPNDRESMNPEAWRNRIAEDILEPGSTMKSIAIAGALDYGVVTPTTRFDCEKGHWFYAGKRLTDSHPMEMLTVSEIVQKSSNIGTAKIALEMGEDNLYQTLRRFGFGSKTGIPLKTETLGIFRPLSRWNSLSITRLPIGYEIGVSPLQLVRAYCALANGGYLVNLNLVDRIEEPKSGITTKMQRGKTSRTFLREGTHHQIVGMMKRVTEEGGTALKAAIEGYEVAGKTGTSKKIVNGTYHSNAYFSSFIGFVPADRPAFVLLVTVDEPKGAYYGGTVSAPAFREVSKRTLRYLNVKPDCWVASKD